MMMNNNNSYDTYDECLLKGKQYMHKVCLLYTNRIKEDLQTFFFFVVCCWNFCTWKNFKSKYWFSFEKICQVLCGGVKWLICELLLGLAFLIGSRISMKNSFFQSILYQDFLTWFLGIWWISWWQRLNVLLADF